MGEKEYKLNHLLLRDDLKLFSKSEEQTDTLVRTVHVFSTEIGMGIAELDKIKKNEMKEKTIKENKRRLWLVLKSKLNGKNKTTAISAWEVAVFRYKAGILLWKEWNERCWQEIKENNDNVWSVTPEEQCRQIWHKEERGGVEA